MWLSGRQQKLVERCFAMALRIVWLNIAENEDGANCLQAAFDVALEASAETDTE